MVSQHASTKPVRQVSAGSDGGIRPGRERRRPPTQVAVHVTLIVMTVAILAPFLWMLFGSLRTYDDLINRPALPPSPWTVANYVEILTQTNFPTAFVNSLVMAVGRVVLACATSVAIGFVFAKYRFWGRDTLFVVLLATMFVPFPAILVPLYLTMSELSLLNSVGGLVIIAACSTFGVFLLRQWITGIPDDYIEAARIDGASEFWVLTRIIVPLSRTPLAALAIFTFLGSWDDYLFPSVVLTDPEAKTLPLALAGLKSLFWERYEIFCAGAMVTVIPVMIVYAFMQRHFIRGLTMGGLKE
jgi:multiple sugar transport system permease protein